MEEIAQAKIELQKYYESVYVNGDGSKRGIKPFKEILRDINNFEKAYKERYNELVSLNEAIIQAKEGSNGQQNSNANNNNTIKNTIETNTSIGNNIIQNNDNNNPNLSVVDLELEQQNLGEQNGKERTNRADEPNRTRAGIPQEIHRRSEHGGLQEGVERSSDEELSHQDPSLFIEPREQGGTRGVYRSSDQQAVSEKSHRERDRLHEHVSRGDGVSAKAEARADSNEHQVKQAEWKMEQEAKKRGIIPAMREEYHRHRNPHLINKIAPEIWGFLSLENSQDRLDAYAFLIMDRWAYYFPQTMKTKEKGTIMSLIEAVIEQTKMETKALDRMEAQIKRAQGVSDMELLKEAQINQYYHLLKADYIMQDSAHQMDLETLKKTGIKREDFYQI
ncbi:hypothetical protein BTM142_07950 [Helicobacter pylori]